jgi:surfactin synthase thioesterase subunit
VRGKNDPFFTVAGACAYQGDASSARVHLLEGGHFVLEEHSDAIARLMKDFPRSHGGNRASATTSRPPRFPADRQ